MGAACPALIAWMVVFGCRPGVKGLATAARRQAALDTRPAAEAWPPSDQGRAVALLGSERCRGRWLGDPRRSAFDHGVGVDQELAGAGDERNVVRLSFCLQSLIERDQPRIPTEGRGQCRFEQAAA